MAKGDPALTTAIDEELLKVEFVRATMKPGADKKGTIQGPELHQWLQPLIDEHYPNEKFADSIHVRYPTDLPLPTPEVHGYRGVASPTEASFVYLDVGAWVGSKGGKWGQTDQGSGNYIKRDFGIVCGPLVLLCTFEYAYGGGDCPLWKESGGKGEEPWQSVSKLIADLSQPTATEGEEKLGRVIVRDALLAEPTNPRWPEDPKDWVIHVVLGDMHIPVLDDEVQTYGGAPESSPRVPRYGRLDVGATEWMIDDFAGVKAGKGGAAGLEKLVRFAVKLANHKKAAARVAGGTAAAAPGVVGALALGAMEALVAGAGRVYEGTWQHGDGKGVDDGTMKREDAKKWYQYYRERRDGQKPADIFENAGDHFRDFVDRLSVYAKKHAKGQAALPAKLLQLGDMLDFWVGFTCHYTPSSSQDQPILLVDPQGQAAIRHWTDNLFGVTKQGQRVADALEQAHTEQLHPVYLYGNHDNYLGALRPTYPHKDNPNTPLARREASYDRLGVFMEHGHQWEGSNADNAGASIPPWCMGTWNPLGMTVTQAAFIQPEPIRLFEGKAAGTVARVKDTFGQRIDQIVGSGYRFLASAGGFYCYVMGHTHSACLTRVVVSTRSLGNNTTNEFRKMRENDSKTRVYLTVDGEEFAYKKFVPASAKSARTVHVEWEHMRGDPVNEWIALEEGNAAPAKWMSAAVKGLFAPNKGGPSGVVAFKDVPPGAWYASYYLTHYDEKPFKTSLDQGKDQMVLIEGLSLRGDAEHEEGKLFVLYADYTAFYQRIVLRWAFDPAHFFSREAWFGLYRDGEPDDRVSVIDPNWPEAIRRVYESAGQKPRRPSHRFFDVGAHSHPWWGSFDFTLQHPGAWDERMVGKWEFRAFNDFARKKQIGLVSFEVALEDGHGAKSGQR